MKKTIKEKKKERSDTIQIYITLFIISITGMFVGSGAFFFAYALGNNEMASLFVSYLITTITTVNIYMWFLGFKKWCEYEDEIE